RIVLVVEPTAANRDAEKLRRRVDQALRIDALIDSLALPDEIVVMDLPELGRAHKINRGALRERLGQRPA
ncbi:MAG TPA: hypothetical protein VIO57_13220, partial [Chloroflexota bacterium]